MNILAITLWVVCPLLFLLFLRYHKRFPILYKPFDKHYNFFKCAYRAYTPVREKQMLYHRYASEFITNCKTILENSGDYDFRKVKAANIIVDMLTNHQEFLEGYFQGEFKYAEYLDMMAKYNMIELSSKSTKVISDKVPIFRKILIFKALFNAARLNPSDADQKRFIRNIVEVEVDTLDISNTNLSSQFKRSKNAPDTDRKIKYYIKDLEYAIGELKLIGLEREVLKLQTELNEYKDQIIS